MWKKSSFIIALVVSTVFQSAMHCCWFEGLEGSGAQEKNIQRERRILLG